MPNLNRALPALPSLDQYRERKPSATHIAQLMRTGRATPTPATEPRRRAHESINHEALIEAERVRHHVAVRKAVEDRMRHHTRMASVTFGFYAPQKKYGTRKRGDAVPPARLSPTTKVPDTQSVPAAPNRKPGLRHRLSRFLPQYRGTEVKGASMSDGDPARVG